MSTDAVFCRYPTTVATPALAGEWQPAPLFLALFCFVLFCFVLSCLVPICFVSFQFNSNQLISFHFTVCHLFSYLL